MNDPGTAEPISQVADDFENHLSTDPTGDHEAEALNFLKPSRWWLASTGAPLAAGTFGPVASFLSICALVQPWRAYIPPGNSEAQSIDVKDPHWLIAVNAISLAFALIANGALLLNMARKLSGRVAQPIIIIGWFISGSMLIGLVAVANSRSTGFRLNPPENYTLTQGFYYAIYASVVYCFVAISMISTLIGAVKGHYEKEFRLTTAQRTLMLQSISLLMYILLGALVFKHVENWRYLDTIYWADFTLLTIGIGSPFTPQTVLGRALLFPFAIFGILSIGLVIGSVRSLALERGKEKMQARFMEKKREKSIKSIDNTKQTIKVSWFKKYHFSDHHLTEAQRREQEFLVMRQIQEEAENHRRWMSLAISGIATLTLWMVGAAVFYVAERNTQGWTYFQALYFAYTSLLTIGYGDIQPVSNSAKPFFVLWTLMAIPTLTILISNMGDTIIKSFSHFTIWAGELTILPGESRANKNIRKIVRTIFRGVKINPREFAGANQPPGFLPHEDQEPAQDGDETEKGEKLDERHELRNHFLDRFARHIAEDEISTLRSRPSSSENEKSSSLDASARDTYNFIYVLIRELVVVMADLSEHPPKKYSYHDWAWYLKLIGQDEANPSIHQQPTKASPNPRGKSKEVGAADGTERDRVWSWLGVRSPLMSNRTEAEWIAERLSTRLEHELDCLRNGRKGDEVPVSYAEVLKQMRKKGDESGSVNLERTD